jgi:hypothetical protein
MVGGVAGEAAARTLPRYPVEFCFHGIPLEGWALYTLLACQAPMLGALMLLRKVQGTSGSVNPARAHSSGITTQRMM